jgi:hypothetical protein
VETFFKHFFKHGRQFAAFKDHAGRFQTTREETRK